MIDLSEAGVPKSVKLPRRESAYALRFHPSGNLILIGMRAKVAIFDAFSLELLAYAPTKSRQAMSNLTSITDGKMFATSANTAKDPIYIFEIDSGTYSIEPNP